MHILPQTYSIVVEMENATSIDWDEIGVGLKALAREVAAVSSMGYQRPLVVFSHSGDTTDDPALRSHIDVEAPELNDVADVVLSACPGGRYYDLKNNGVRSARGEIIVFSDSDTVAEPHWLSSLLAPFQDSKTIGVNGFTYILHDDFFSRMFALIWFFPMAHGDMRFASKRAMNANNVAFRHEWIASHPYVTHNGFKVSCTLLGWQLRREGHQFVQADARSSHYSPRGWRFFVWRALVTGRDADRKFVELKSPTRVERVVKSFTRWFTTSWRTTRRVLSHARGAGMPIWQIPFALMAGLAFYTLAFVGQLGLASGLVRDKVEILPLYVEHS